MSSADAPRGVVTAQPDPEPPPARVDAAAASDDASLPTRAPPWLLDTLWLLPIAVAVLAAFRATVFGGAVFAEDDTRLFYYPLMRYSADRLLSGALPLWTPDIFAGYPLFSDGEAGPLYAPNLLVRLVFGPSAWFGALSVLHFLLAGLFAYVYARTVGVVRPAATVAGLVFALGGFLIAQAHHTNVVASAVWLPAVLACAERALSDGARQPGRPIAPAVLGWTSVGGLAHAMQWLGVHIQPAIMSAMLLGVYVLWRTATFRQGRGGVVRALVVLGGIAAVGLAVAAAQVLPLYELGVASRRAEPQTADFGNTYATPPWNLVTLLSPFFFRTASGLGFDLWPRWEIALYVGIAPLLLAPIAIWQPSRRSFAWLWLTVALGSLLCAVGGYLPLPLHGWLWQLPGFAYLRAPGRFSFLLTFAAANLAGLAVDALALWLSTRHAGARRRLAAAAVWTAVAVTGIGLGWWLARGWLVGHREAALGLIERRYLALAHAPIVPDAATVYAYTLEALAPRSPGVVTAAGVAAATAGAVALAAAFPRAARRLFAPGLVAIVALDLVLYASAFHPTLPFRELAEPPPAAGFLAGQPGDGRVFAFPGTEVEANRLLPFRLAEIGGYSSLQSSRSIGYTSYLRAQDGALLDLAGVRWLVVPAAAPPTLVFEGTRFDVPRPLFSSGAGNPSAETTFRVDGTATEIRVISRLQNSTPIPDGDEVARVTAVDSDGQRRTWPLRAGVETAEWAWDRPDVSRDAQHRRAPIAYTWHHDDPASGPFDAHLYTATLPLPAKTSLARIEIVYTNPTGRLQVNGLSLFDGETGEQRNVDRFDNARFRLAWADASTRVWENAVRAPRAFLVPRAVSVLEAEQHDLRTVVDTLGLLAEGHLDYRDTAVLLDGPPDVPLARTALPLPVTGSPAGRADATRSEPERTVVTVSSTADGWLVVTDGFDPGWTATVDGRPATIYRADSLFRGIRVPAGDHTVEMRYRPPSLALGAAISAAALLVLAAAWGLYWRSRRMAGRRTA